MTDPSPYPQGTTFETTWLDALGQPVDESDAVAGETVIYLPDGSTEWITFDQGRQA